MLGRLARTTALTTSIIGLASAASAAQAQEAPAPRTTAADQSTVEEVVVTAQKRSQSLQDVPISISAVSGDALAQRRTTDFSELQKLTPGLSFSGSNTPRGAGVAVRGVGTVSFSDAIEGSVGIVLDGVPIGRQGAGFTDLADLERVEVLRGPQGTLFGKNASAGIINIVTKRPSKAFTFDGGVSYGEDADLHVRADVSGPLGWDGRVRGRLSAYDTSRDGYIANQATGEKLNERGEYGLRGKVEVDLTSDINLLVTADYTDRDVKCCMWTTRTYGSGLFASGFNIIRTQQIANGIVAGPENLTVREDAPNYERQQTRGLVGELNWKLPGGFTFTSITAARSWHEVDNNDADQTTLNILDLNHGAINQRQFSEEARLASPTGGRIDYVVGVFYFNQGTRNDSVQRGSLGLDLLGVIPAGRGLTFSRDAILKVNTENYAAFGDVTWHVFDRARIFGGLRETHEELATSFNRFTPPGNLQWPNLPPFAGTGRTSDTATSWRIGAQYDIQPRIMGYATIARGYKGQGFEVGLDQSYIRVVQAEIPTNYEVGIKSELFARRLVLNVSAFRTDFENYQAQTLVTTTAGLAFDTANAGSVVTQGVELDFTAVPVRGLTVSGGLSYLDATFDSFKVANCYTGQAVNGVGCIQTSPGVYSQDLSGRRLPNTPHWNPIVNVRYERDLRTGVSAFGSLGWTYRSDALLAQNQDPLSLQKAYSLVDGQLGVTLRDRVTLSVYAKNIFDQRYAESIFDTPFDTGSPTSRGGTSQFIPIGAFRTVGVALDFRY